MPRKSKISLRTLVTFLLDRSGSMSLCRAATIEAFNAYLSELQKDEGQIDFSFLQFDTQSLDKIVVAEPVKKVPALSEETFVPRGGTPLIDAAYKTIKAVESAVKPGDKVVICIQTDGEENASREHTWEGLSALVREKTAAGWQFNFMGAGIDAYAQGAKMGIAAVSTMSYDHNNRAATMGAFAASASNTRAFSVGLRQTTAYSSAQRSAAGDRFVPPTLDLTKKPAVVATPQTQSHGRAKVVPDFSL